MPRYIDADKAVELIKNYGKSAISNGHTTLDAVDDIVCLAQAVDYISTADVVEVKRGEWISELVEKEDWKGRKRQYFNPCSCSICHEPSPIHSNYNYCPHCGAKMGGKDD